MFGLEFKRTVIPTLAVLVLGLGINTSSVSAATTSVCPDDGSGTREFTLTTEDPVSNSCYFWGPNNDANDAAFVAQRLADFGSEHTLLSKVEIDDDGLVDREGTNDSLLGNSIVALLGGLGGEFTLDTTGFKDILLVFKTGTGRSTPGFAAFALIPSGPTEGEWSVNLQQGLSHVSLYGSPAPIPVPAAGILLITALGGLGIAARRRRKSS